MNALEPKSPNVAVMGICKFCFLHADKSLTTFELFTCARDYPGN